ncbi:MAG: hypothetical protein Q9N67_03550 [Ghiorsea sp.]|nr:hypothetical protein [Ghiorsea sp.]
MVDVKKPTWKDVKTILTGKDNRELIKLVSDLYALGSANKTFIHARYSVGKATLDPYKVIISDSLYPDVYKNKPIKLAVGRKAISDYFKATKDELGKLALMFHYLEMGNQFTVEYGDIDEAFYSSLESMFEKITVILRQQPKVIQDEYVFRLGSVVESAQDIGWGYYDCIDEIFEEFVDSISTNKIQKE